MNLHEEYIHRHKLDVAVIRHDRDYDLLLKKEKKWRIISFRWKFDFGHPGFWTCRIKEPIYCSYSQRKNWFFHDSYRLYWDQYDDHVRKLAKTYQNQKWTAIHSSIEKDLFYWEIFLYMCDRELAEGPMIKKSRFLKSVSKSLNKDCTSFERWEGFKDAFSIIEDTPIANFFYNNICGHLGGDSEWFSKLVEDEKILTCTC